MDRVLYQKEYYIKNKGKSNLTSKLYNENNKKDVTLYHEEYYIFHKELYKEKNKNYKKNHKQEIKTRKENFFIDFDLIIVEKALITLNFD